MMEAFIRDIPKAELHIHIEDLLEPELMFNIARRNGLTFFGGYMTENFQAVQKALNLDQGDIYHLVKNSFQASFLTHEERRGLLGKLDQFVAVAKQ